MLYVEVPKKEADKFAACFLRFLDKTRVNNCRNACVALASVRR